jgi:hypothetical protein
MIVFLDCRRLRAKYLHRCRPLEDLFVLGLDLDLDFGYIGRGDDWMDGRIDPISYNVLYTGEM